MNDRGFFAKIVRGELPEAPITKLLGWRFLEFDASQQVIKVEMQARAEFINPAGVIHGGMLAAMLDETLSPALAATLGPGEFAPTLEIKVNFISPAKVGRVLGTGRGEPRPLNLLHGRAASRRAGESPRDRYGDFEDRTQGVAIRPKPSVVR
jgi:uncharacterized protein (TIGR00369 family)